MVALRPDEWKPICSSASSTVTRACFGKRGGSREPGNAAADDQDVGTVHLVRRR